MLSETLDRFEGFIERTLWKYRLGWYRATVSSAVATHRRVNIDPEWCDTPIRNALRVSSPALDIIPAIGSTVAVISRDGVPEAPAVLGQVWDENNKVEDMTVWLRADLATQPGHLEVGATQSLKLHVGVNGGTITPGTPGTIAIGNGTVELLDLVDQLIEALETCTAGGFPLDPATLTTLATLQLQLGQIKE